MRLKEIHIKEEATAGATASGNIASIANPHVTNPSRNSVAYTGKPGGPGGKGPVKQVKGGTYNTGKNALDMDVKLLSSKEPQMIRRQIQEGSLYEIGPLAYGIGAGAVALGSGLVNLWKGKKKKEKKLAKPKADLSVKGAKKALSTRASSIEDALKAAGVD